jgi:archaellum component FlaC
MEKLGHSMDRITKGKNFFPKHEKSNLKYIDGLRISNSQVKRLERELKNLKEEVSASQLR